MPFASLVATFVLLQTPQIVVKDEKVGQGPEAKIGDIVTINYTGRALNGVIFDSTKLTAPFAFVMGARTMIQGHIRLPFPALDKALVGMKAGGIRTVTLPGELAFGEFRVGDIPPGEKLTFEVEMFDVRPKGSEAKVKIEELKEGVGEPAGTGDTIDANYTGRFLNGLEFDTSRGKPTEDGKTMDMPISVVLGDTRLIAGFLQGLTGMRAGGKRRVTIPYELAYGKEGRGNVIPAYSVLVFDLEAIRVQKKPGQ